MSKICLSFVFNNQFENNIPKLRELYDDRFSTIRYLSPFSRSQNIGIVPVFETSIGATGGGFFFSGLFSVGTTTWIILGDSSFFRTVD